MKLPHTPQSQIKSALRKLFLRSREHHTVLKRSGYCCERCGIKQTKPKDKEKWVIIEVHHRKGMNWPELIRLVREYLLCPAEDMEALCKKCHLSEK
jgi:predicted HNH restriction endonuclease